MALENEVAALVTSTTALQNEVGSQLAKVRAENTTFQATVVSKSGGVMTGPLTLPSVTTTLDADFNGIKVGRGNSLDESNTVVGLRSGNLLVGGVGLTVLGADALSGESTGNWNTAIGRITLALNTTGGYTTALGNGALTSNTTGSYNTGLGFQSLANNTTGENNTGVGVNSVANNTTGVGNTATGIQSLHNNTTGNFNTAIGKDSVFGNTTGSINTGVGYSSLNLSIAYSNATGIGYNSQVSGSNQVQLGDGATTTFTYGAVQNRSDERDKADIRPTVLGLDFIKALKPKDFRWDMRDTYRTPIPEPLSIEASDEEKQAYAISLAKWQERNKFVNLVHDGSKKKKRIHHGLIAQDIAELIKFTGVDFGGFQDHKRSGGDDVLSIGYSELIAPLIKAVQELAQANEELRGRIATLEARK